MQVQGEVRLHHMKIRTLLPGLPESLARHDTHRFRHVIFGQNNPMAQLRIAAHDKRHAPQGRIVQAFDGRVRFYSTRMSSPPQDSRHLPAQLAPGASVIQFP
jgi:hypothetical protein